jgi:hypothetical protein
MTAAVERKRRASGTGSIIPKGNGWAVRVGRGRRGNYVGGFPTRDAAEEAARAIAGQRALTRIMHAVARVADAPTNAGDAFAWAASRWADMNPRERQAVTFSRFGGRCIYCGRIVTIPTRREVGRHDRAVMDHRVPVAGGGADSFANVVLSCHGCNAKKLDDHAAPVAARTERETG